MPIAVIVDWYGPYDSLEEFKSEVMGGWGSKPRVLYMALGSYNKVRYVGLTEKPGVRFYDHAKLKDDRNRRFYAGKIVTQGISGPRPSKHAPDLKLAERAFIWCLKPELNTQLKESPPEDCVAVVSRFFDPNNEQPAGNPLPRFPSILAYNSYSRKLLKVSQGSR